MSNELRLAYKTSGLTGVTAQLYLGTSAVGPAISCTEITGSGVYVGSMPNGTAAGLYVVVFSQGGSFLGAGQINWDGNQEILTGGSGGPITLDGITSNGTTAIRNALAGQNLGVYSSTIKLPRGWSMTIVQGDDCLNANNHALGGWICPDPSLVGTTAYLAIHLPGQTDVVSAGVSVTSSTQTLWFELPRTVTANMLPDEGTFDNRFVDSSGRVSTWVVDGVVRVKARIG